MKKNKIIKGLSIGLMFSFIPMNIFSNSQSEKSLTDEINVNNIEPQIENNDNRLFAPASYKTLYYNNFTQPIVSPNPDLPGFLGYEQPRLGFTNELPRKIVWTASNLFAVWSSNLRDHPSIRTEVAAGVDPVLITAIHSDNFDSQLFKNEIFTIVADGNDMASRKLWLLRYDVENGNAIVDTDVLLPMMNNFPIPNNNWEGGVSIVHDLNNSRYIVYYPGLVKNVKNEMFSFSINKDNNRLEISNNATSFPGKDSWRPTHELQRNWFHDDNLIVGLESVSSNDGYNLNMIVHTSNQLEENKRDLFRTIELKKDLGIIEGWNFDLGVAAQSRKDDVFENENNNNFITIQRYLLTSSQIIPKISIVGTGEYHSTVTIITKEDANYKFSKISFKKNTKTFDINNNGIGLSLPGFEYSQIPLQEVTPFVSYGSFAQNEIYITTPTLTVANAMDNTKYKYVLNPEDIYDVPSKILVSRITMPSNTKFPARSLFIEYPFQKDNYLYSLASNLTANNYVLEHEEGRNIYQVIDNGGNLLINPQSAASGLGWLRGQGTNAKRPADITNDMITGLYFGAGSPNDTNKFIRFALSPWNGGIYGSSRIQITPTIVNIVRDNARGILSGTLNLSSLQTVTGPNINRSSTFDGNVSFRVDNLRTVNQPTSITSSQNLSNNIASSLNSNNVSNLFTIINLPNDATILEWKVTNKNNIAGTATITAKVDKYFDSSSNLVNSPGEITFNATNFKKVKGTSISLVNNEEINLMKSLKTVWDVREEEIFNFVNIEDKPLNEEFKITYTILDRKPLLGTMNISVKIEGAYYDPANNGLPNTDAAKALTLGPILVSDFKKIEGSTNIEGLRGNPGISPSELTETDLINYINVINQVPNSTVQVTRISNQNDDDGNVTFDLSVSKAYNATGNIIDKVPGMPVTDPNYKYIHYTLTIAGFAEGVAKLDTRMISTANTTLSQRLLPSEVNETNINQLTMLLNKPETAIVRRYEFTNEINVNPANPTSGGSLDIVAIVSQTLDEYGQLIDGDARITLKLTGLKALSEATNIKPNKGNSNELPQNILINNIATYYSLVNPSPLADKPTTINIIENSYKFNNNLGSISFSYTLNNYFDNLGRFSAQSGISSLNISGFQKLNKSTSIAIKGGSNSLNAFSAEEFNLTLDNFDEHFNIVNPLEQLNTRIVSITKVSFDNNQGKAKFRIEFIDGYVDSNFVIKDTPGFIEQEISGFKIIQPDHSMLYGIIGGSVGGVIILAILIGVLIYMLNRKKMMKQPSRTQSAPPSKPTSAPIPPASANQAVRGPMPTPPPRPTGGPIPPPRIPGK